MHPTDETPGVERIVRNSGSGEACHRTNPVKLRIFIWIRLPIWLVLIPLIASCANLHSLDDPIKVLIVGNSIVYTNNLPAVLDRIAVAQADGGEYRIDMFARGGASLSEWAKGDGLLRALAERRYDVVVFQERGGDDLCVLKPSERSTLACQVLIDSHIALAALARQGGARVLYLGTYQFASDPSRLLVAAEASLASMMRAEYIEINEHLRILREEHQDVA